MNSHELRLEEQEWLKCTYTSQNIKAHVFRLSISVHALGENMAEEVSVEFFEKLLEKEKINMVSVCQVSNPSLSCFSKRNHQSNCPSEKHLLKKLCFTDVGGQIETLGTRNS